MTTLALFSVLFLITSPKCLPHLQYLQMVFKVVTLAILGSYLVFLSISHVYKRLPSQNMYLWHIHYFKLFFIFRNSEQGRNSEKQEGFTLM